MKPQETTPILTTLAPAALLAPQVAIAALVGIGLLWLLSKKDKDEHQGEKAKNVPTGLTLLASPFAGKTETPKQTASAKKITREDLAEVLQYGAHNVTRSEAVAGLQARGFRKTAAYKALAADGKFGSLIELTPDGLIEWKG
jgi:hypothetical protein